MGHIGLVNIAFRYLDCVSDVGNAYINLPKFKRDFHFRSLKDLNIGALRAIVCVLQVMKKMKNTTDRFKLWNDEI